jgi:hypothetical protein
MVSARSAATIFQSVNVATLEPDGGSELLISRKSTQNEKELRKLDCVS